MKKLWLDSTLETQRCILKIPQESEAEYMWNLISSDITEYMLWDKWRDFSQTLKNIKKTRKKAESWNSWDAWIYLKKTWKCIGRCGIIWFDRDVPSIEIGYWISSKYWGKWYVPECVKILIDFSFKELP